MEMTTTSLPISNKNRLLSIMRLYWPMITLFLMPILLTLMNNCWVFSEHFNMDPWYNLEAFCDLKGFISSYKHDHHSARIGWLLPGHLAYSLFSPSIAPYVLSFGFYYGAIFSLFYIFKKTIGPRTAFILTVFAGCNLDFLYTFSTRYIDGAVTTYLLLTLLMLIPFKKKTPLSFLLAGFLFACCISTQFFIMIYAPIFLLIFLYFIPRQPQKLEEVTNRNIDQKRNPLLNLLGHSIPYFFKRLTLCLIGFISALILFGLISTYYGGSFLYLTPAVSAVKHFSVQNDFFSKTFNYLNNPNLILPGMILIISVSNLIFWFAKIRKQAISPCVLFQSLFVIICCLFMYINFIGHQPVLQIVCYTSYITPLMLLALGSLFATRLETLRAKHFAIVASFSAFFSVFPYLLHISIFPKNVLIHAILRLSPGIFLGCIISLLTLSLLIIYLKQSYMKISGFLSLSLLLSLTCIKYSERSYSSLFNWKKTITRKDAQMQKDATLAIYNAAKKIRALESSKPKYFWCNIPPRSGPLFYEDIYVNAIWSDMSGVLIGTHFPSVSPEQDQIAYFEEGRRIFILSTLATPFNEALNELKKLGLNATLIDEATITSGMFTFKLTYIELCANIP